MVIMIYAIKVSPIAYERVTTDLDSFWCGASFKVNKKMRKRE